MVAGQPNQLLVAWQPPMTPNGLIVGYTAYCFESRYDRVNGSGSASSSQNITSYVSALGSDTSAIVGGLSPYTRYDCFVTAHTSIGEGEASYAISGITDESSKLISLRPNSPLSWWTLLLAPGSPPINLAPSLVGATFVLLSWSPPTIPNGRITSYTITYNLTGQLSSVVVQNATVQYLITGLDPYSYYQFTVFASTYVGGGPPTIPLILRTATASKSACVFDVSETMWSSEQCICIVIINHLYVGPSGAPQNFIATATGKTSAQFTWQPPPLSDQNGIITYYLLRLVDESYNLTNITINITNTDYTIATLEEYVRYSCQVAAATEAGVGPYSSPVEIITQQDG